MRVSRTALPAARFHITRGRRESWRSASEGILPWGPREQRRLQHPQRLRPRLLLDRRPKRRPFRFGRFPCRFFTRSLTRSSPPCSGNTSLRFAAGGLSLLGRFLPADNFPSLLCNRRHRSTYGAPGTHSQTLCTLEACLGRVRYHRPRAHHRVLSGCEDAAFFLSHLPLPPNSPLIFVAGTNGGKWR